MTQRYNLIKQLIKQYDRLHSASVKARNNKQFKKAINLQARARWILQTADRLFEKFKANNEFEERVEFT
jgi:hypothetical protein